MAIGSRRSWPTPPAAAAVVSEEAVAPRNVPCCQLKDSITRGMTLARRPPKKKPEIGTPFGLSQSLSMTGHWEAGAVNRALGCAAGFGFWGVHCSLSQLTSLAGFSLDIPSHQTSPSGVRPQFVKMQFLSRVSMAFLLDSMLVPGATPKKPYSGLIA